MTAALSVYSCLKMAGFMSQKGHYPLWFAFIWLDLNDRLLKVRSLY